MSIQVSINKDGENELRELGWTIPQYPETGEVLLDGKSVGWMDNFSGLVVKDSTAIDWLKKYKRSFGRHSYMESNMAIWNIL